MKIEEKKSVEKKSLKKDKNISFQDRLIRARLRNSREKSYLQPSEILHQTS